MPDQDDSIYELDPSWSNIPGGVEDSEGSYSGPEPTASDSSAIQNAR